MPVGFETQSFASILISCRTRPKTVADTHFSCGLVPRAFPSQAEEWSLSEFAEVLTLAKGVGFL